MFNADGSEGMMCGNAIRCVGKYLYERGLISPDARQITIETASGVKELSLSVKAGKVDSVSVDMGVVEVSDEIAVETAGKHYHMIPVSVGNPHWVCFVDDLCEVDVEFEGARLSSAVEGGVNVEFVERIDGNTLRMRVFERGSGVTLACGTGACASVADAVSLGICPLNTPITVLLDGGALTVIPGEGGRMLMIGGAEFVYDGVWEGEI